jgi:hypothetical protein
LHRPYQLDGLLSPAPTLLSDLSPRRAANDGEIGAENFLDCGSDFVASGYFGSSAGMLAGGYFWI